MNDIITVDPLPTSTTGDQFLELRRLVDHYKNQGLDAVIEGNTVVVTAQPGQAATSLSVKNVPPHAYTRIGTILGERKGRPRPKILEPVLTRGTRSGRNDPCQCGSGKKRKRCHP